MKKRLFTLSLLVGALILVSCGSSKEKLIVGTEAGFAPYEYIGSDGKVVGVDMDISQAIAEKMGRELEVKDMDFDGALAAVQSGKVDMVAAGVSVNPERQKIMDFSENYIDSTEVVVVNTNSPAVAEPTGEALNDKIVAVQQGNVADLWVSDEENTKPKEIKRYSKFTQAAEDLRNNKVDAIVMDQAPGEELVAANNGAFKILEGEPLFVDQYAIAVKKGNTELLNEINAVIKELKAEGKIEEFLANHSESKS